MCSGSWHDHVLADREGVTKGTIPRRKVEFVTEPGFRFLSIENALIIFVAYDLEVIILLVMQLYQFFSLPVVVAAVVWLCLQKVFFANGFSSETNSYNHCSSLLPQEQENNWKYIVIIITISWCEIRKRQTTKSMHYY